MKYLFVFISFLFLYSSCCKEQEDEICCQKESSFVYKGSVISDTLLWQPDSSFIWDKPFTRDDLTTIGVSRFYSNDNPNFFFGENLVFTIPLVKGEIEDINSKVVNYGHGFIDYLGDKYGINTSENNYLEVLCVDTLTQMISVAFDLHFIRDDDPRYPSYPFPEKVSFTEGLFCGSYGE